jgi:hypothetical protein
MEQLIASYTALVGGFHPLLWLGIFALCLVGEFIGLTVPYLLEMTWLLAGYLLGSHEMSLLALIPMIFVAAAGRLVGMSIFYRLAGAGSLHFFNRFPALKMRLDESTFSRKLGTRHWSVPLWIALGRLFWLRFPISLVMSLSKRYYALATGVIISALIYESTYVAIGIIVGNSVKLSPLQLLPYFFIGLTLSFAIGFATKQLWSFLRAKIAFRQKRYVQSDVAGKIEMDDCTTPH